ncbi:MAG: dTMP kinase [Candidatus Dependentiae bacterium]|nr:dTMP kinase [Candidatus Dependentiae bacterium]
MKKFLMLFFCSISLSLLSDSTMQINRGYLFSIEGTEGCGKTTLVKNLVEKLSELNLPVFITREPGATELGKDLRAILMNRSVPICVLSEFLLFAADRAQHFEQFIMPHLAENHIVISDRMADSSLVYQGHVKGLDQSKMKFVNQWAMQNRQPDLIFYLKIDPILALERMHKRNEGFLAFEQEILQKKNQLVEGFDLILKNRDNVVIIDATASAEEIVDQVLHAILEFIQQHD